MVVRSDGRELRRRLAEKDIRRGEDGGIGKPELLKGDLSGWASRRITQEHRLGYRVTDAQGQIEILSCRYH
ncbi:Txe/YoeB family addiction module toxin [Actinoplanes sp. NPDC051851]|uniref:Txe/YoeB family addiction module toxin n=1 Tax=Actinoplanes sp. NPDC051851 TaxID=3154753 RepID=UPI0034444ECA